MRNFVCFFSLFGLFVLLVSPVLAVEPAPRITDREIVERLTRLEEGQKALNQRFDDVNQRFDDVNRRFDDVNRRFDDVSQRFDDVNRRIDDLRAEMNTKFNIMLWMLGTFITIALVILSFVLRMLWIIQKRQAQMETELEKQRKEIEFLMDVVRRLLPGKTAS